MDGAANAAPLALLNLMGCDDFLHLVRVRVRDRVRVRAKNKVRYA